MLEGVRVVDLTTDIAGPYCTKVLADAGRRRGQGGTADRRPAAPLGLGRSVRVPQHLQAVGPRRVPTDLVAGADVLVAGDAGGPPRAVAGQPGPRRGDHHPVRLRRPVGGAHPSTEFTLQAACGSTGQRGLPEQPPLAAGGRIGEWVTGTYAALGAMAAYREARRCGRGEHVDVAMLDCMAVTMVTYPSVFASFSGWPEQYGTGRVIEVPSVEPSKDGYFNVTTNSAQQFQDFLLMIGRPDLLEDPDLAVGPQAVRPARRVPRRRARAHLAAHHGRAARRGVAVPDPGGTGARRFDHARVRAVRRPRGLRAQSLRTVRPAQGALSVFREPRPARSSGHRRVGEHTGQSTGRLRLRTRRARGRHPVATPPAGDPGHRLHGVVGRAGGRRRPLGLGSRRDQGGVGRSAGLHALRQRPSADRRAVVGVGRALPRGQRQQARHHARPDPAGRGRDLRTARPPPRTSSSRTTRPG